MWTSVRGSLNLKKERMSRSGLLEGMWGGEAMRAWELACGGVWRSGR
jgi:hypothetical protein